MSSWKWSKKTELLVSIIIMILGFLFLIWRVRFGYCFNDEPFILSLAHRLSLGDKLIIDEWHPTQLFGIIVFPIFKLYYFIKGSTEGLLLFSRLCFCFFWLITASFVYIVCRRYTIFAISTFVFIVLFAPFDYMTCSYSSFGLIGILLLSCVSLKAMEEENIRSAFLNGIISSFLCCTVVLCSPFFSLAYFLVVFSLLLYVRWKHNNGSRHFNTILVTNVCCTITIGVLCIYCFSLKGHTFFELIDRIPQILNDPAHKESILYKIIHTIAAVYRPMLALYVIGVLFLCLYMFLPNGKQFRCMTALYWAVVFLFSRISIASAVIDHYSFNYEMLDLGLLSFVAFTLLNKKPWKLFFCFSVLGLLYATCTFLASNTKLMALSAALVPCGAIGIVYIAMLAGELKQDLSSDLRASAATIVCVLLLCQFSLQICIRTSRQFWDNPLPELSETIQCGAAKGLITTPDRCKAYENEFRALETLLDKAGDISGKRFLSLSSNPVLYLDADLRYGTFSAWSFGYGKELINRLSSYYDFNPGNKPDLVYYTDEEVELSRVFTSSEYRLVDYDEHHLLVRIDNSKAMN